MPPTNPAPILSHRAGDDRDEIYRNGLDVWGQKRADAYLADLFRAIERLAHYPLIGRQEDRIRPGLRALPVGEHVIYYRVGPEEQVRVSRNLHRRQDPNEASEI